MIGIFDSGVGGMTVARAIEKKLPSYNIIYFGDLARTPYGSKSAETIIRYSLQNTEFLISKGAKLIVIACNSAASVASNVLQNSFDIPVFEVITPAVSEAVVASQNGKVGVVGTRATISSNIYETEIKAIDSSFQVFSKDCPLFVPLVEEGWINKPETKMIIRRYLTPLKQKAVDTLVLGCTHYPLLLHLIKPRIGKRVKVIDSSEAMAENLKNFLENNPGIADTLSQNVESRYYVSDVTEAAMATAKKIFGRQVDLNRVAFGS